METKNLPPPGVDPSINVALSLGMLLPLSICAYLWFPSQNMPSFLRVLLAIHAQYIITFEENQLPLEQLSGLQKEYENKKHFLCSQSER